MPTPDPPRPDVSPDVAAVCEREARYRALFARIDQGFCICAMIVDADGVPVDVFATPVPPHGHFALVFTDVTARRLAEEALQARERRTRLLADTAPAILWVTDALHRLEFISRDC